MTHYPTKMIALSLAVAGATCLAVQATANAPQTISQKKRTYAPGAVTLKVGETLRVLNDDIFLHHAFIDAPNMEYDSGSMEEGESRDIVFDKSGNFVMKCAIHPKMKLDVTVK